MSLDGDGHAATGGVVEADALDAVDQVRGLGRAEQPVAVGDELPQRGPVHGLVDEAQPVGQDLVEDDAADGRPDRLAETSSPVSSSQALDAAPRSARAGPAAARWWLASLDVLAGVDAADVVGQQRLRSRPRSWRSAPCPACPRARGSGSSSRGPCPGSAPRPGRRRTATAGWRSTASSAAPRPARRGRAARGRPSGRRRSRR